MFFNRPAGERRSVTEQRCLCKKRNEQRSVRETENNLNDSYIAITSSFDDILVFVCIVYSTRLSEKKEEEEKEKKSKTRRENEIYIHLDYDG